MKSLITVLTMLVLSTVAQAQTSQIGAITAGGSGCVGSNIKTSFSQGALTIAYPQFQIQPTGRIIDRVNCSLAIPVAVPAGFQLVASAASSGLARLQGKDSVKVTQELFTAGTVGKQQILALTSASKLFTVGKLGAADALAKSACGQQTILRLNLNALIRKTSDASPSSLGVSKSQITFRLVPCK